MEDELLEILEDFIPHLKFPEKVSLFFKLNKEISAKDYYFKKLKPHDALSLYRFIEEFASGMKNEISILAVGSSTFGKKYWNMIKKINKKDPTANAKEDYQDIDLLILPKNKIERKIFEEDVKNSLYSMNLIYSSHKSSSCGGEWYKKIDGKYKFGSYSEENKHSYSARLSNLTLIDLIIGKEELLKSASEKIAEERKLKSPFSLIHG
jgi:hypothetical protein